MAHPTSASQPRPKYDGDWHIIGEYTEVESGRRSDRPQLVKALAAARLHRVPIIVAKVDRLTRSVAFLLADLTPEILAIVITARHEGAHPQFMFVEQGRPGLGQAAAISRKNR